MQNSHVHSGIAEAGAGASDRPAMAIADAKTSFVNNLLSFICLNLSS